MQTTLPKTGSIRSAAWLGMKIGEIPQLLTIIGHQNHFTFPQMFVRPW